MIIIGTKNLIIFDKIIDVYLSSQFLKLQCGQSFGKFRYNG